MKSLNEEIQRIKELISLNESSKYSKAVDTYDNLDFKDGVVGNSRPSQDAINPALLKDIDTAAKNAGVQVSITTAISGHYSLPSRHPDGNAVDIAIINGRAVSKSNRGDADKFVNALVNMGYTKNKEIGSDKAVLTFGFPDHDDHVHVSNRTGSSSDYSIGGLNLGIGNLFNYLFGKYPNSNITQPSNYNNIIAQILKYIFPTLKEGNGYGKFGNNISIHTKDILIPSKNNETIKSPINGIIENYTYRSNCKNQITIKHTINDKTFYLEYCGIKDVKVSKGDYVSSGTIIGTTDSDVTVYFYNEDGKKQYIEDVLNKKTTSKSSSSSDIRGPIEKMDSPRNPLYLPGKPRNPLSLPSGPRNPLRLPGEPRSPIE